MRRTLPISGTELPAVAGLFLVALNPTLQFFSLTRDIVGQGVAAGFLPLIALTLIAGSLLMKGRAVVGSVNLVNAFSIAATGTLGIVHGWLGGGDEVFHAIYFIVSFLAVPAAAAMTLGPRRAMYWLFVLLMACAAFLCIGSIVMPDLFFVQTRVTYTPFRLGWFANPNMYGVTALVGLMTAVVVRRMRPKSSMKARRPGWLLLYVAFCVSILLSDSRASALALAVFLFTLFFVNRDETVRRLLSGDRALVALFGIALVVAGGFVYWDGIIDSVEGFIYKHDEDIGGGRLALWQHLISSWWTEAPLFGLGVGAGADKAQEIGFSGTHNSYLRLLLQYGIVGALLMFFAIMSSLRILVGGPVDERFLFAALVSILIHSVFEDQLFSLGITMSSVVFAQLMMVGPHPNRDSNRVARFAAGTHRKVGIPA